MATHEQSLLSEHPERQTSHDDRPHHVKAPKSSIRNKKGNFTLEQPVKSQRNKSYRCTLSLTSVLDRVGGELHAQVVLPPGRRLCTHYIGVWSGPYPSGRVLKIAPAPTRTVEASSESLYRLSYPGPQSEAQIISVSFSGNWFV